MALSFFCIVPQVIVIRVSSGTIVVVVQLEINTSSVLETRILIVSTGIPCFIALALLYSTNVVCFLHIEAKTLYQQEDYTHFIPILSLFFGGWGGFVK